MTEQIMKQLIPRIDERLRPSKALLVAIDGRCASGKTTLAAALQAHYSCSVIHMDSFFLRPEQRTRQRLNKPGENVDHERFLQEVLLPLKKGEPFSYRPFDCGLQALQSPVSVAPNALTVIEGSYSFHEKLREFYDLRVFLRVDPQEQMRRILERNGPQYAQVFQTRWIPLEEAYFAECAVEQCADYCFCTSTSK